MVRIAIFSLKDFVTKLIGILILIVMFIIISKLDISFTITTNLFDRFLCSNIFVDKRMNSDEYRISTLCNILKNEYNIFDENIINKNVNKEKNIEINKNKNISIENIDNRLYNIKYDINNVDYRNNTTYDIDYNYLLNKKLSINKKTTILIIHTHGSESYSDIEHTDYYRNEDLNKNVINIGSQLASILIEAGYNVIHDTILYDYPTYSGSYTRALESIERYKSQNSNIDIVIDLHRDAVSNDSGFAPMLNIDGKEVSKLMLIVGTDCGGMEHENWKENLAFALKLNSAGQQMYPGIFRQMCITNSRYNQHATVGSILLEVGATGNTMEQSINSIMYFAKILDVVLNEE